MRTHLAGIVLAQILLSGAGCYRQGALPVAPEVVTESPSENTNSAKPLKSNEDEPEQAPMSDTQAF